MQSASRAVAFHKAVLHARGPGKHTEPARRQAAVCCGSQVAEDSQQGPAGLQRAFLFAVVMRALQATRGHMRNNKLACFADTDAAP